MRKHKTLRFRGTTVVEAAIVLPLLLMVTLGALEYGWLFLNAQRVTNIARQAARIAILPHATAQTEAISVIDALIADARLSDDDPTRSVTSGVIPGDPQSREGITVTVSVSTANLAVVNAPGLLPIPGRLSSTVTMAKEGG